MSFSCCKSMPLATEWFVWLFSLSLSLFLCARACVSVCVCVCVCVCMCARVCQKEKRPTKCQRDTNKSVLTWSRLNLYLRNYGNAPPDFNQPSLNDQQIYAFQLRGRGADFHYADPGRQGQINGDQSLLPEFAAPGRSIPLIGLGCPHRTANTDRTRLTTRQAADRLSLIHI